MQKLSYLLLLLLLYLQGNAQILTKTDKDIIHSINKSMAVTIDQLRTVVNINSGSSNMEGVKKVGIFFKSELEKLGFTVEWIPLPDSLHRAGHLFAYKKGNKGKRLLLLGHLDTVFEPDQPWSPFSILGDTAARGQGVVDMKGGDMIILAALQALDKNGILKDAQVGVWLSCDEELGGKPVEVSRRALIDTCKNYDVALGFESGRIHTVVTARRGSSTWKLSVRGKQAHSSSMFGKKNGFGAIYETARILDSFQIAFSKEKYLTISPGLIAGGTELSNNEENMEVFGKSNVIASQAYVQGDLRYLKSKQLRRVRQHMKEIVTHNNLPGTEAEIEFYDGIPSMESTMGNKRLLGMLNDINLALGLGPVKSGDPAKRGAGDISFVAPFLDAMDGLGASGRGSHKPDETLNLKEFPFMIQRAALLMSRLMMAEH